MPVCPATSEATPEAERELLYFPGGMHYAIEHKLGETPVPEGLPD